MFIFVQMSSDEEESTSPVLPKDSDQGSSVSSELQVIKKKKNKFTINAFMHKSDGSDLGTQQHCVAHLRVKSV